MFKKVFYRVIAALFLVFIYRTGYSQTAGGDSLIFNEDSNNLWWKTNNTGRMKQELQGKIPDWYRGGLLKEMCIILIETHVDEALESVKQYYLLAKKNKDLEEQAWSLDFMGAVYLRMGNTARAVQLGLDALKMLEAIKDTGYRSINYLNLANAFNSQKDPRAFEYYNKSLNKATKDTDGVMFKSWTLLGLGSAYFNRNMLDSSNYYAQQSYQIFQTILKNDNFNHKYYSDLLNLLGRIQQKSGNANLALEYFRLAIGFASSTSNLNSVSDNYLSIALLFKEIHSDDSSMIYGRKAYAVAGQVNNPYLIVKISSFLKEYYLGKNRLDSAFKYEQILTSQKDSLLNLENARQVQNLAFDEQVRQQEIQAEEEKFIEQRIHNLQYAAIFIGIIVFIILFLLLSRTIIVRTKFIEFFNVLGLLSVFEFINLLIHPYLEQITGNSPIWMLLILIGVGALLVPLHHKSEKWLIRVMVEKNKKIRLAAAKKTIENLEGRSPKV
jgi:tetratricopeptide (TPR) repeat protein